VSARYRKRRDRREQTIDLFSGLGAGDPGYRLRPGASGLDPLEAYDEMGRVTGLVLKSMLDGRSGPFLVPSLFLLVAGLLWFSFRLFSLLPAVLGLYVDARWVLAAVGLVLIVVTVVFALRRCFEHREGRLP
jgi:hypothetical protein